jgi:hypothetical protein
MQTVPETTAPRKPRAFYAQFHGLSGVITRPAGQVLFLEPESGAVVTLNQADAPHLVVLGEVAASMAQHLTDLAAGGYAAVVCGRLQEVA